MKTSSALDILKALAQESRLALFRLLVQAGADGLPVGGLAERLGLPGATLSNHLNVLRAAGLVRDERRGRTIVCRADYARMDALIAFLTENCCAGDASACAPAPTCAPKPRSKRP
ncbi:MAG: metalloregulator ArsR/SmtB family transcription factor [Mizugakiibacter sp.]|uniref:ArsR/SmtB family transcription factor n=1 Tax=Mizugakiibacter sp. TaxID=1972610 RepID=UPI0031C30E74|nr:metalloregulator ArsR/SmtB family transcription factor [Xanthomonadaceae bacterium]